MYLSLHFYLHFYHFSSSTLPSYSLFSPPLSSFSLPLSLRHPLSLPLSLFPPLYLTARSCASWWWSWFGRWRIRFPPSLQEHRLLQSHRLTEAPHTTRGLPHCSGVSSQHTAIQESKTAWIHFFFLHVSQCKRMQLRRYESFFIYLRCVAVCVCMTSSCNSGKKIRNYF